MHHLQRRLGSALQWSDLATAGLDDLGGGRYQSCDPDIAGLGGVNSFFGLFLVGPSGLAAPEIPAIQTVDIDGQWYVSPVGSIGVQIFDVLVGVPDHGILSIDSPLAVYVYGTNRDFLERRLGTRPVSEVGASCAAIVTTDAAGIVDGIIDAPAGDMIRDCVASDALYDYSDAVLDAEESAPVATDFVED